MGFLSAKREAMSFEEQFTLLPAVSSAPGPTDDPPRLPPSAPGTADDEAPAIADVAMTITGAFHVRTAHDTFFALSAPTRASSAASMTPLPTLRADAAAQDGAAAVRVRMQARFKPRMQAAKRENMAREHIGRLEIERAVGRKLGDEEVRKLKRARKDGNWHEALLDARVGGKHDKFAS